MEKSTQYKKEPQLHTLDEFLEVLEKQNTEEHLEYLKKKYDKRPRLQMAGRHCA